MMDLGMMKAKAKLECVFVFFELGLWTPRCVPAFLFLSNMYLSMYLRQTGLVALLQLAIRTVSNIPNQSRHSSI
jgi:hypothetical protein